MKTCITCGIEKEGAEFKRHRKTCNQCLKEEEAKRKQEDPEYLESCRAYHREYYRENAEHLRGLHRDSYKKPENKKKKAAGYEKRRDARTPEQAAVDRASRAEKSRKRYQDNPEEVKKVAAFSVAKKIVRFNLLKIERPCYDCGGIFPPEAMDWDHRPGTIKCFDIAKGVRSHSEESVIDEINKCQLVCACCHRVRTKARTQEKKGDE